MATNYDARLKKMKSGWADTKKRAEERSVTVDPGVYIAQVQKFTLGETSNNNLCIKRQHLILEGEFEGSVIYDQLMLEGGGDLSYTLGAIDSYGYEIPDDPTGLADTVEDINDDAPIVRISHKVSDEGYSNVRVLELIEDYDGEIPKSSSDGDTYTEDEINEMDSDQLDELIEEHGLDVKVTKSIATYRKRMIKALDDAGLISDEEPEESESEDSNEDEKSSGDESSSDGDTYTEDEINEMKRAEILDVIEAEDLDVDTGIRKISALREATVQALKDEDLLESSDENEEEEEEDGDLLDRMVAVCKNQMGKADLKGVELDEPDYDELKEFMSGFDYEANDLSEDEVLTLKEIGLEDNILKPKRTSRKTRSKK